MNLDESEKEAAAAKNLSRKEKKALKAAQKLAAKAAKAEQKLEEKAAAAEPTPESTAEVEAELEPASVPKVPPPHYTTWEKISPPAKRKKQLATMESGYREVLGLVHSMRENQEVLMESFKKLPEAVDSVRSLAEHSAQQSKLLTAMNEQLESGSAGKFNETLSSMDKTTQLLLERAQRSEERLYGMLRRAQRRIAFMTLLVLLLFLGTGAAILFLIFPDQTRGWLEERGFVPVPTAEVKIVPVQDSPTMAGSDNATLPEVETPSESDGTSPDPEPVPEPAAVPPPHPINTDFPPSPPTSDLPIAVPSEAVLTGEEAP